VWDVSDEPIEIAKGWSSMLNLVLSSHYPTGMDVDDDNNIYIVSNLTSTIAPGVVICGLTKVDPCGNSIYEYSWFEDNSNYVSDVAVDSDNGRIYVVGQFEGTNVDFDPGPGTHILDSTGASDAYIAWYDLDGVFLGAGRWGSSGMDSAMEVALNYQNEVFVAGGFETSADFDPGPSFHIRISNGQSDAYVSKFNSAMSHQWAMSWGGAQSDKAFGLDINADNMVYVCGRFKDSVDFDSAGTGDLHMSNGAYDAWLLSMSGVDGTFEWCRSWGGTQVDEAMSVAAEGSDSVYTCGNFASSVDFDPSSGINEVTAVGIYDAYLSKFTTSGGYAWTGTWGDSDYDVALNVAMDAYDNSYVTGYFHGTIDLDPGTGESNRTSNGENDAWVVQLNPSGIYKWGHTVGGSSYELGRCVCLDNNSLILFAGSRIGDIELAPTGDPCYEDSHFYSGDLTMDVFINKYLRTGCW
jgi:hypothetical protein